jgi:hypothetical protein
MATTTTPDLSLGVNVETLERRLRVRWDAAPRENQLGNGADVVDDALDHVIESMVCDYRVFVGTGHNLEPINIGKDWSEPMEDAARDAGRQAWNEHVLPAIAHELAVRVSEAPDWFLAHPESGVLRGDLEAAAVR